MIKAVIFDIDNTMYDYDKAHQTGMRALIDYSTSALSISEEGFLQAFRRAQEMIKERTGMDCAANHNRLLSVHSGIIGNICSVPRDTHVSCILGQSDRCYVTGTGA